MFKYNTLTLNIYNFYNIILLNEQNVHLYK